MKIKLCNVHTLNRKYIFIGKRRALVANAPGFRNSTLFGVFTQLKLFMNENNLTFTIVVKRMFIIFQSFETLSHIIFNCIFNILIIVNICSCNNYESLCGKDPRRVGFVSIICVNIRK